MAENSEKVVGTDLEDKGLVGERVNIECAVCLQNCIYPVQLPCKHIFCFLCVKGVTLQSKRCAMCRREIPQDYLFNPELLDQDREEDTETEDETCWFYEGRNGWWKYDQRTSSEIEHHQKSGAERCELLIAGFLYIIDFTHMLQYRRNDPSRRRGIKRDIATVPKKGVAGLRIGVDMDPQPSSSPSNRQTNPAPGSSREPNPTPRSDIQPNPDPGSSRTPNPTFSSNMQPNPAPGSSRAPNPDPGFSRIPNPTPGSTRATSGANLSDSREPNGEESDEEFYSDQYDHGEDQVVYRLSSRREEIGSQGELAEPRTDGRRELNPREQELNNELEQLGISETTPCSSV